ncbi:Lrp/AsnC family transcriptional regulator [Sulfitobacter pacificus]|uniref:Lrp/AsnC family transcriptional regulator n=1 Tax=Sulfitobacter pacificus TaxID=1499314 RepID=UPI003340DC2A
MGLDDIDKRLLLLLTRDARASAADLARALSVSRGTVQNRIDKLMRQGVIEKFTVEIGVGDTENQISAFALIHLKADDDTVIKASLRRIEDVTQVSTLSGTFDLVVELRCASLARLDTVLDAIRKLPDVADTQSHIRLRTWNN